MYKLQSKSERAFRWFSIILMGLWTLGAFLPFLLIVIGSLTDETTLVNNGFSFFPEKWSFESYIYMVKQYKIIFRAYGVSIVVTAIGTAVSLVITSMLGYVLSRPDFRLRNIISFLVYFTMLFNGGIVPSYIMWTRGFGINNTLLALLLPNYLMNAFNVFLVRNYYKNNIPLALQEAARVDGANNFQIYFKIMLPLTVPVNMTISLFTALAYWNDWTNALYYVDDTRLYGIQNLLVRMMNNIQFLSTPAGAQLTSGKYIPLPSNAIRMSMAVIGILPIMVALPFVQKYIVRGVVIGAVKE